MYDIIYSNNKHCYCVVNECGTIISYGTYDDCLACIEIMQAYNYEEEMI